MINKFTTVSGEPGPGQVSLGPSELATTVGLAVVPFVTLEAAKAVRRKPPHWEVRGSGAANG